MQVFAKKKKLHQILKVNIYIRNFENTQYPFHRLTYVSKYIFEKQKKKDFFITQI